ncbi:MAG: ABC transporter substrate-binding protein [Catenulispora sp.]|nr:ABC transporter substrate-binding protein [Catenulispora sp.]
MASAGQGFELPVLEGALKRRRRRRLLVAGSVVVVAAAAGLGLIAWLGGGSDACGGPGSGVSKVGGECVGVTDGSYAFSPELSAIEKEIADENASATKPGGPVVTVAVLDPMTVDATSPLSMANVRNDLEGAYTAQYRVNHTHVLGDQRPLIRLVLANEGSHEDQWQPVVHQLEGMVHGPAPLVAVTGMGVSTTQTRDGAKDLAGHDIPTIAAIDTADQLNAADIHGFIRVVANNAQYVASLRAYLDTRPDLDSAILVFDSNSDKTGASDLFTKSLRDDLQSPDGFQKLLTFAPQGFAGVSEPSQANPDLFANITANICSVKPKAVFYAGRGVDLPSFVDALKNRVCDKTPITLLTAGNNLGELNGQAPLLQSAGLTVVYATMADQAGWLAGGPGTPHHFPDFAKAFHDLGFPDVDLVDGGAIMSHDAVLAATQAARLAAQAMPQAQGVPNAADVLNQEVDMNTQFFVPGAGGDLSFTFHGDNGSLSSEPIGKPLPVISVPPETGEASYTDVYTTTQ